MSRFRAKFKNFDFGPKNVPFNPFDNTKFFLDKMGCINFPYLLSPNFMQKIRKKKDGQTDGQS